MDSEELTGKITQLFGVGLFITAIAGAYYSGRTPPENKPTTNLVEKVILTNNDCVISQIYFGLRTRKQFNYNTPIPPGFKVDDHSVELATNQGIIGYSPNTGLYLKSNTQTTFFRDQYFSKGDILACNLVKAMLDNVSASQRPKP